MTTTPIPLRNLEEGVTTPLLHNNISPASSDHSDTSENSNTNNNNNMSNNAPATARKHATHPPHATTHPAPEASWWRRKIVQPFKEVLKSGMTPEGISASLAFGLTGGVFPVPATTTFACILLTYFFKLNFAAVQITNMLMTPVNLATFLTFIRYGDAIFGAENSEFSLDLFQSTPIAALRLFWAAMLRGIVAWLLFLPIATGLAYVILLPIIRKLMGGMKFT